MALENVLDVPKLTTTTTGNTEMAYYCQTDPVSLYSNGRFSYDEQAHAGYVRLKDSPIEDGESVRQTEPFPGVIFDFDKDGNAIGIEILFPQPLP